MNINFSTATRGKLHAPHIVPGWDLIPCLWLKRGAKFSQAPQEEFSLSSSNVRRTLCFLSRFPSSGLNLGSCFMSQGEGMSESPVETLEKAVGLRLIWTGGIISPWQLERHTEFNASKGDVAWLFLKMDRNPNIIFPSRKWALVSCLTSRSVRIVLPTPVSIPEVSIVNR